ncbi:MAG: hypothetical protein ACLTTH_12405 [Holdemanella porci]
MESIFQKYRNIVEDCKSGKIKANIYHIKAIDRFYRDLEDERYEFNPKDADLHYFDYSKNHLPHARRNAGRRTFTRYSLLFLMPFHKFIIYNLFESIEKEQR